MHSCRWGQPLGPHCRSKCRRVGSRRKAVIAAHVPSMLSSVAHTLPPKVVGGQDGTADDAFGAAVRQIKNISVITRNAISNVSSVMDAG